MVQLPFISIITSCFNSAPFLKRTIESVLSQTYIYFEWIIVNDGSDDDTETIVNMYNDSRIRYFKQENKGQCNALNFGISNSIGDYIKFLDADDYLNCVHLEKMLNKLIVNDPIEKKDTLVLCKWQRFSGENNLWKQVYRPEWRDSSTAKFIELALGNGPDMLPAWQWLIPRTILNKAGGWNEELGLGNDFEFSIRLLIASRNIVFCDDAIVFYRSDLNKNMSSDTSMTTILSVLKAARLGIDNILAFNNNYYLKRVCADKLQVWLVSYYPLIHKSLIYEVENEIKKLGGFNHKMKFGIKMQILSKIFGWKKARMLQFYYYKFRYNK
jgi:glycosyltransferase involved in cell wall biosynthesis